jgi:hypothetical protein
VIEAIRLGARGFLAKPFDRAQALDAVHEALSGAHGRSPGIDAISEPATHPDEKREFPRVETRLPVVLESGGIRLHTATLNASGGGMLVADVPVRPGDHVDFRIHLNDSQPPVDGSARVVRVDPDAGPALAFERLPAEDYERLISYLYVAGPVPS